MHSTTQRLRNRKRPDLETLEDRTAPALITVTNVNDSGPGSLRQALSDANSGDTITFAGALNGQTISLTSGELTINKALTIDGDLNDDGIPDVTVVRSASASDFRIFNVDDGNTSNAIAVTLDGLTITGGQTSGIGGGIFNREALSSINTTITGNSAEYGGGVSNYGTMSLSNSTISGNSAQLSGGAIENLWVMNLSTSTVSGNSAQSGGGGISQLTQLLAVRKNPQQSGRTAVCLPDILLRSVHRHFVH